MTIKIEAAQRLKATQRLQAALGKYDFGPPDGLVAFFNKVFGFEGKESNTGKAQKWVYNKKWGPKESLKLTLKYADKGDGRSDMSYEGEINFADGSYSHLTGRPFNSDVAIEDLKAKAKSSLRNLDADPKSETMKIITQMAK